MQEADFSGAFDAEDNRIVADAISSLSDSIERATRRHWYTDTSPDEDTHGLIPTSPQSRDDEHDIPTSGALVHGASEHDRRRFRKNSDALLESDPRHGRRRKHYRKPKREIRLAFGELHDTSVPAYTRIGLERKDVEAVNELLVVNADGAFDDWTEERNGGVGVQNRGEDWWVRRNNLGRAELYLDVHEMDDDIASLANAVYVDIDYGKSDVPTHVRRGTALLAASELVLDDEYVTAIPDSGQLINVETKAERWARQGVQKLEAYIEDDEPLDSYR